VDIQNEPLTANDTANDTAFSITLKFNHTVMGFEVGDITVGNGSPGNFQSVDSSTYTADITPDGNGNITIDVSANVVQDANANTNTAAIQAVVTYDATPPVFTSPSFFNFSDNETFVGQASATDNGNGPITFSLIGGVDENLFMITADGLLSFKLPPDINDPADQDGDNNYLVTIQASDGLNTREQLLTVGIKDSCNFIVVPKTGNENNSSQGTTAVICL